jgi:hypothetical protein
MAVLSRRVNGLGRDDSLHAKRHTHEQSAPYIIARHTSGHGAHCSRGTGRG